MLGPNIGVPPGNVIGNLSFGSFVSEYNVVYRAMTTKPAADVAEAQNDMVKTLVDNGRWSKLDIFYLYAQSTNDDGEALLDWKQPAGGDNLVDTGLVRLMIAV
jgi:hypothetical protein